MAHHLAEAICELAAPPRQPSFIRVQAYSQGFPGQMLLLHVQPRRLAAGLEVAVYHGITQDEEATVCHLGTEGTLFAVPRTQAGLEKFAADLLDASPDDWDEADVVSMALPAQHDSVGSWRDVRLDLVPPALVRASERVEEHGRRVLCFTSPSEYEHVTSGVITVRNCGADYVREQRAIKRRIEQQQRTEQAAAAAGSGSASGASSPADLPQADSPEELQSKWQAFRHQAMAELKDALAVMLRQAVRFRGRLTFPIDAHGGWGPDPA